MISDLESTSDFRIATALMPNVLFAVPLTERDQDEFESLSQKARDLVTNRFFILEKIHDAPKLKRRAVARAESKSYNGGRGYSVTTLLDLFYAYDKSGDWRVLIDKAKAGAIWQQNYGDGAENILAGCTDIRAFTLHWHQLYAKHKRSGRFAREELLRTWDRAEDIPGYGDWKSWFQRTRPGTPLPHSAPLPAGWGRSQLYRLKPDAVQLKMSREGTTAALSLLPHVLTTREGLRFMEIVTFDDVKTDFRILHRVGGRLQVCDLWLLVAIDRATGLILGYWVRPAVAREDGTQSHLTLRDMKQLCGWVLWTWGVPSYVITWKLERGTATLGKDTSIAIAQIFGDRIAVSFNSMTSKRALAGYVQKAKGNSRAKAGHEATNNLIHNACDDLAGQTGPTYQRRPADLIAREKHALEIWDRFSDLPENLRDQAKYPLQTLAEARRVLNERFDWINNRTQHQLEGYEWIGEWRESAQHIWQPLNTLPAGINPEPEHLNRRKQSPMERAAMLKEKSVRDGVTWDRVPGSTIARIYDTHRRVVVQRVGEVSFRLDDKLITFRGPADQLALGREFLAYFNEQTPGFAHLTQLEPSHAYVCTAALYQRHRDGDSEALQQSMRYTALARSAAETEAQRLGAPETERIAQINEHNAALIADADAIAPATNFIGMRPANDVVNAIEGAETAIREQQDNTRRVAKVNTTQEILKRPAPEKRAEKLDDW